MLCPSCNESFWIHIDVYLYIDMYTELYLSISISRSNRQVSAQVLFCLNTLTFLFKSLAVNRFVR